MPGLSWFESRRDSGVVPPRPGHSRPCVLVHKGHRVGIFAGVDEATACANAACLIGAEVEIVPGHPWKEGCNAT